MAVSGLSIQLLTVIEKELCVEDALRVITDLLQSQAHLQTVENLVAMNSSLLGPMLKKYAEETKRKEEDEKFTRTMYHTWAKLENPSGPLVPADQSGPVERIIHTLESLPARSYRACKGLIREIARSFLRLVSSPLGGTQALLRLALPGVYMTFEAFLSIRRWWNGEISGKRCVKNVTDVGVGIGTGVAVGVASSFLTPFGIFVGIAAGSLAAKLSKAVSDRLFEKFFGLPRSEALENAFKVLNLSCNSSNEEIARRYRKLCLKHHPDRGGRRED